MKDVSKEDEQAHEDEEEDEEKMERQIKRRKINWNRKKGFYFKFGHKNGQK